MASETESVHRTFNLDVECIIQITDSVSDLFGQQSCLSQILTLIHKYIKSAGTCHWLFMNELADLALPKEVILIMESSSPGPYLIVHLFTSYIYISGNHFLIPFP